MNSPFAASIDFGKGMTIIVDRMNEAAQRVTAVIQRKSMCET